jgi:predicted Mrr-cat superfamily restriction endonuclease
MMVAQNGFTSTAWGYWRENRDKLLRPMEEEDLLKLLQENYEKLSDEAKGLLPLRRVLVPVSQEDES